MDTYTTSTYIIHLLPCHQDAGGHTTPPPATPEATSYIVLQNTSSLLLEEACTYTCRRLSLWEAWVYTLHVVHKGAHLAAGSCCIYTSTRLTVDAGSNNRHHSYTRILHTLGCLLPSRTHPDGCLPAQTTIRPARAAPTRAPSTLHRDATRTPPRRCYSRVLQPAHGATSAHSTSVCASPSSPQGVAILDCVCIHCAS